MRKLLALLVLLSALPAYASFGAASAWDIRTTGADTNGGAFDSGVGSPGTDESQGSGTACTVTLTGTTTGTGSCTFSATTHGPGNFINIASGSGCTTGWFEVLSQTAGVATFDHAMGTATNTCVGVVGGSLLTIGQANTNIVSGNFIWLKSGTYTLTSGISLSVATVSIIGYNSTHGDNGTRPLITTATNSVRLFDSGSSNGGVQTFQNLNASNTAGTRSNFICQSSGHGTTQGWVFINDVFDGFNQAIDSDNGACDDVSSVNVIQTEIKNDQNSALVSNSSTATAVSASYFHDNTGNGHGDIYAIGSLTVVHTTVARAGSSTACVQTTGGAKIANSNFVGCLGSGIFVSGGTLQIYNSVAYGNGSYGIDSTGAILPALNSAASYNNAVGGNTSGAFNGGWVAGPNAITLTADPFTSSASGDFSLNSTAGGGALLKGAALPGVIGASTGHLDVGAIQSASSGGGSGTYAYTQ